MIHGLTKNSSDTRKRKAIFHYLVCGLLTLIILILDLSIPLGVAVAIPYIAIVVLSFSSPNKKFTIFMSIICSLLTIVGFFFSPQGEKMWVAITNRLLTLFAIWIVHFLVSQKRELDRKLLHGLLPICASCKKIRDDKGYWNQVEAFIKEHSEANFSHSVCPECAKLLYPKFYDKVLPGEPGDKNSKEPWSDKGNF
ncbi:MAG: hypothetical protein SCALA701_14040 [Candidatus Scalindua sp.]|nr:MAG: hypothetical protein SCALA701_14040 [Candidatus Scalindua sp.]